MREWVHQHKPYARASANASMDFVALDVETANPSLASICQIAVANFSNGLLANERRSFV
jgi:hypothetical protein